MTSIEKDHIRVQGFDIRIKGSSRTELTLRGRRLVEVKTGPDMTILGSFSTMHGIRSETDRSTFLKVTHSDGSETELRVCEQPHRKYLLSDVLRAGYPGVGRGALETYRISDVRIGDEIEMSVQDNLFADPVCNAILICARPGGKVPPSPGEAEFRKIIPPLVPSGMSEETLSRIGKNGVFHCRTSSTPVAQRASRYIRANPGRNSPRRPGPSDPTECGPYISFHATSR